MGEIYLLQLYFKTKNKYYGDKMQKLKCQKWSLRLWIEKGKHLEVDYSLYRFATVPGLAQELGLQKKFVQIYVLHKLDLIAL